MQSKNPINTVSKENLEHLVRNAKSFSEILRSLNLCPETGGSRFRWLKHRLQLENIDYSHIKSSNKGKSWLAEAIPINMVLVENSNYSRKSLKKRLIKENILKEICKQCGQLPLWKGKELVLVLDHKNGVRDDNRLENLQLLCPNCNSQSPTFSGRMNRREKPTCSMCGKERWKRSVTGMCYECMLIHSPSHRKRKVEIRPSRLELEQKIKQLGFSGTGRKYGVSDNCIRKWIAQYSRRDSNPQSSG